MSGVSGGGEDSLGVSCDLFTGRVVAATIVVGEMSCEQQRMGAGCLWLRRALKDKYSKSEGVVIGVSIVSVNLCKLNGLFSGVLRHCFH